MPDLKSELSKVINAWETPEPTPPATKLYFSVTNNVTRITFDYVRDNPGKTRKEAALALGTQGFKASSVTSLLGQMVKQGHVRETQGLLYATTDNYAPLKSSRKLTAMAEKPQAQQRKIVTITRRAAPVAEPTLQSNSTWNVTDQLNSMSIVQARLMYDALRKIFGG